MKRFFPNIEIGLTKKQVNTRIQEKLVNNEHIDYSKSIAEIIKTNTFTLFNILNLLLGLAIFFVRSYQNLLFLGVVFCNTTISIIQEIRAKKTIDKLSIVNEEKVLVIRDKNRVKIATNELVLDDIIILETGNQICTDCIIEKGLVEVNESLITGEETAIVKNKKDLLLSGSYVVSGSCIAKVEHVGHNNYATSIVKEAKYIKKVNSQILNAFNKILKFISIAIIPIGAILFAKQIYLNNSYEESVITTVAALIGMIPEGLILLTSSVMAVSTIRLARKNVLVQRLYAVESLARVDVICFDKTGTLTEGIMEVNDLIPFNYLKTELEKVLGNLFYNLTDNNATAHAIRNKYQEHTNLKIKKLVPFSSSRKFSGITYSDNTSYVIGAYEMLFDDTLPNRIIEYKDNYRILAIAKAEAISLSKKPKNPVLLGFIVLQDKIKDSSKKTIAYLKKQKLDIKIISGDNVSAIKNIVERLGLKNIKCIDMNKVKDENIPNIVSNYNIFGRTTPKQKKAIIVALKNLKHTVAMVGDGVNDVLALKEADCSIAMALGSDAAKNVSEIILLNSDFEEIPRIVNEGRKTINNIERSSSLFLTKTIYASLLAIIFILLPFSYPFIPIQLTLTSVFTIGIPSFVLALEPNDDKVEGNFLLKIIKRSVPAALTIIGNILIIMLLSSYLKLGDDKTSTLSVVMTALTGFILLYQICKPFNILRALLYILMLLGFFTFGIALKDIVNIVIVDLKTISISLCLLLLSIITFKLVYLITDVIIKKRN